MLLLSHLVEGNRSTSLILISHIKLRNLDELTCLSQRLKHLFDVALKLSLLSCITIACYVHLCTNTIDNNRLLCIRIFPQTNPVDQAIQLSVLIPVTFQVVVIDKELQLRWITIVLSKALTCISYGCTNIVDITEIILPVEAIGYIRRKSISCMLQLIESISTFLTRDRLVHNIPRCNITISSLHHTINPLAHCISKKSLLLFIRKRNGISRLRVVNFKIINKEGTSIFTDIQQQAQGIVTITFGSHINFLPISCNLDGREVATAFIAIRILECSTKFTSYRTLDFHLQVIGCTILESETWFIVNLCIPGVCLGCVVTNLTNTIYNLWRIIHIPSTKVLTIIKGKMTNTYRDFNHLTFGHFLNFCSYLMPGIRFITRNFVPFYVTIYDQIIGRTFFTKTQRLDVQFTAQFTCSKNKVLIIGFRSKFNGIFIPLSTY